MIHPTQKTIGQGAMGADHRHVYGSLEMGRFLAASTVVLYHLIPTLNEEALSPSQRVFAGHQFPGILAVQWFFVLSGFVMMTAHGKDFGRIGAIPIFWWRRLSRIYPLYLAALLVPCSLCFYHQPLWLILLVARHVVILNPTTQTELVAPAWSLRYEVAFYIMFGACMLPRIGKAILLAWITAVVAFAFSSAAFRVFGHSEPHLIIEHTQGRFGHFISSLDLYFFSGLLAGWIVRRCALSCAAALSLISAGVAGLLLTAPDLGWGTRLGSSGETVVAGLCLAATIAGSAGFERAAKVDFGSVARLLGRLSYPIYILHMSIMLLFSEALRNTRLTSLEISVLIVTEVTSIFLTSFLLDRWLDRPTQAFLRSVPRAISRAVGRAMHSTRRVRLHVSHRVFAGSTIANLRE